MNITLPDGSVKKLEAGSTGFDFTYIIQPMKITLPDGSFKTLDVQI